MIQIQARLTGFSPKHGNGKLEDGTPWSTDRVDLHCLTPLDESKGSKGYATTIYKVQGCNQFKDLAASLVGTDIIMDCQMVNSGRGGNDTLTPISFKQAK